MAIRQKITITSMKTLSPGLERINDTEIPGFHARISKTGRITYYLYYRLNGQQANFKIGTSGELTATQARDLAKLKAADIAQGVNIQADKKVAKAENQRRYHLRLDRFLEENYLPFLESRNPKTAKKIFRELNSSFKEFLDQDIDKIVPFQIEKWRNRKIKDGLSPTTINYYLNTLKGALSRAVDWGVIEKHDLNKVKAIRKDNTVVRYLSTQEEARLRTALKDRDSEIKQSRESANEFRTVRGYELLPSLIKTRFVDHLEAMVLLAMNTGMRRGEILSLEWSQVDLINKVLTVTSENSKSKNSRHIPLNGEAFQAINDWKDQTSSKKYVFESKPGIPFKDTKKGFLAILKDAEIESFRFHDLRHHFASKLVMAGVDLNTVRELLGHSDLKMTLRYAHLAPEHKAAAVNLIG
jgi:integrase